MDEIKTCAKILIFYKLHSKGNLVEIRALLVEIEDNTEKGDQEALKAIHGLVADKRKNDPVNCDFH